MVPNNPKTGGVASRSAASVEKEHKVLNGTKPNFLIIGAQKAGSEALLAALREHPQVWMPAQEDPFFRDPLFSVSTVDDVIASYSTHAERAVGMKCPDYLARPEVPERLAHYLRQPRLIAILRNPVDRTVSAYFWYMRWGLLPVTDVNTGLVRLLNGDFTAGHPSTREILDWGLYHKHLSAYLAHFPRESLLILRDSALRRSPQQTLQSIADFLDLSAFPLRGQSRGDIKNQGIYDLRRQAFLQRRNRVIVHPHEDGQYVSIPKPSRLLDRAFSYSIAGIDRYLLRYIYGNARPALRADVRSMLESFYEEDCRKLELVAGPNPDGWPGSPS
jgi:hypothetical protein